LLTVNKQEKPVRGLIEQVKIFKLICPRSYRIRKVIYVRQNVRIRTIKSPSVSCSHFYGIVAVYPL